MRVAVVHGYFLQDSGSGIYVRELSRALTMLGHDVTLVCQDREPERCDFIDASYILDDANESLSLVSRSAPKGPGRCRLVRPDLGGELLVYVEGEFPPFDRERVRSFQNASPAQRDHYVERIVRALRTTFAEWPPELVIAQHLIMQPYVVTRALEGAAPYVVTEHGSALNFSVRANRELVPFALEGLSGAACVVTVSSAACDDLAAWAAAEGLDIGAKVVAMPPGVDADLFAPASDRETALRAVRALVELPAGLGIDAEDDIVAFAGALRPTKGVQHAIAAMPRVARARGRRTRLVIAGDGPSRAALMRLDALVRSGDAAAARALVASEPLLQSPPEWGDAVPHSEQAGGETATAFLGHLDHRQLAAVFALADVCVAPSVFPEAAALVNVEALMAGALPVAAYHSGMAELVDLLAVGLEDATLARLVPGRSLTTGLADLVSHVLDTYATKEPRFRREARAIGLSRYPTWSETARDYVKMAAGAS